MTASARAAQPSYVVLPREIDPDSTVLQFLVQHFNRIDAATWRTRVLEGKVHWLDGSLITQETPCRPMARVYYYREVPVEAKIPFEERILHQDEHAILVYKPHFLPVTPSGNFVNECLVHRLRLKTGISTIVPAHRLDRETAGIILMTVTPETRHLYHALFVDKQIRKEYQALARLTPALQAQLAAGELQLPVHWTVKNRLQKGLPSFTMRVTEGEANSHSEISLVAVKGDLGLFELSPITGKTHQLRVHMQSLGMPLLNDRFYPQLQPKGPDDFAKPLQLLARRLSFIDPVSGRSRDLACEGLTL
ncbi:pseudouridine synthase [Shewanella salipaludis]|uniref:Pseudouridine synthase n=1 Tax=Shewanella salipaludis TaxID=2723052 RepID=A0A972FTE6_9GAMM|nr:pseudouridine synthase [Shewanella salipaludis]NMH65883.1 pseudouridine synthase [Shewanella salipaludis]